MRVTSASEAGLVTQPKPARRAFEHPSILVQPDARKADEGRAIQLKRANPA
jgi:hypothetical protein